jgi:diguanylate cyclase (GGDEF)-like protein
MTASPARVTARHLLCLALEGELAGLPAHERREQYRRQIQLLHSSMSNLLLALTVLAALVALGEGLWLNPPAWPAVWQGAGVAALAAMAWRYRKVVSIRRRRVLGSVFAALLLACLALPIARHPGESLLPMAVFLLLPVIWLPLLVRPMMTFGGLAGVVAVVAALLWQSTAPGADVALFAFYFALAIGAGLLLRRARANLATRLDRKVETLWQRAVSDPLTGLLNREGWMNLAGTALAEAVEAGLEPVVLFIDVDHFKRTNDQHGHLAGDELLQMLGRTIESRIGPGEFCARLGGEEFACLLPGTGLDGARRFAERLSNDYRQQARDFSSTLSIGIAGWGPGDQLNDLLAQADAALYQAKREGRDRIVLATRG